MSNQPTIYKFHSYNRELFFYHNGKDVLTFITSYQTKLVSLMSIAELKKQGCMDFKLNGNEI